jgi:hypothetical protein
MTGAVLFLMASGPAFASNCPDFSGTYRPDMKSCHFTRFWEKQEVDETFPGIGGEEISADTRIDVKQNGCESMVMTFSQDDSQPVEHFISFAHPSLPPNQGQHRLHAHLSSSKLTIDTVAADWDWGSGGYPPMGDLAHESWTFRKRQDGGIRLTSSKEGFTFALFLPLPVISVEGCTLLPVK